MKRLLFLVFSLLLVISTYGQVTDFTIDHRYHANLLGSARDSLYQQVLSKYDQYIRINPANIRARLERCKFMQNAMYDAYEEYNPNYEEAEACARELTEIFPGNPEVLLYPAEYLYGDSLIQYMLHLEEIANADTATWKLHSWMIYERLAQSYDVETNREKVISYGEQAISLQDTLDLSVLLAEAYKTTDKARGVELLTNHLDSADESWNLNRKGTLLLELGAPEKAIEVFRMVSEKDSTASNFGDLAKALIDNGMITEAREFLLKDYHDESWNQDENLHALMEYDLAHGSADSARVTYRRLTDLHFANDLLALYRLRMIMKSPLMGWTFGDVGRVLTLLAFFAIALIIPYLWILPIHYIGSYLKEKGKVTDEATFRWRLRHFWIVCSCWIICSILASACIEYPILLSHFNDQLRVDDMALISKEHANLTIFFSIGSLLFTIGMLKWREIVDVFSNLKVNLRYIGVGLGLAVALRFGLGFYVLLLRVFGIDLSQQNSSGLAGVKEAIVSINQFYSPWLGFLIVVILVPIYEEILFRGIFLSACQRNMKFWAANILQSLVFAVFHDDLKLIPFYLAFGMVAGVYVRKTESLATGTYMHMFNNFLAFITIYVMQSRGAFGFFWFF